VEHRELTKRRSRAARKKEQGCQEGEELPAEQDQEEEGHQIKDPIPTSPLPKFQQIR
jgi:hypothetical protein